jgi:hypothetical protein
MKSRTRENESPLKRKGRPSYQAAFAVVVILAATLIVACGGSTTDASPSPTAPSPPPTPTVSTNWMVTHQFVSVTGPDNCWITQQREKLTGIRFPDLDMTVERPSGGAITLRSPWFETYSGTINSGELTAQQVKPLESSGVILCPDGSSVQQLGGGVSKLEGFFSADDQLLTAYEVNSYRLATGEAVHYTWEWRATRR